MTDYVMGVAEDLKIRDVETWTTSLASSNFRGTTVLFAYSPDPELLRACEERSVSVVEVAGRPAAPLRVNKERWRLYSEYVARSLHKGDRVVAADVRDLFFQRDPSDWLDEHLSDHELATSAEGVAYEDEPWNRGHAISVYGTEFYERYLKKSPVVCAGLVAGLAGPLRELCDDIYEDAYRVPRDASDQVVLNGVLALRGKRWRVLSTTDEHCWGCHGAIMRWSSPAAQKMRWPPPEVLGGRVCNSSGHPYAVVHQYDRVPAWAEAAETRLKNAR